MGFFTLNNENDEPVSLTDYIGKQQVLVYFYPKAMTPGCTVQAQGLRDIKAELAELNTVVFGISPDEVKRLTKFCQRDELNFSLLSDVEGQILWDYCFTAYSIIRAYMRPLLYKPFF